MEILLTQSEADLLIAMEKHRVDETVWRYPSSGGSITIPLISSERKENFLLDIRRSGINLSKGTYQNRGRRIIVLVRLDFGGSPHRNPDGIEIPPPHLHIYREGYGDKWAIQVPKDIFAHLFDPEETIFDFMRYCNITRIPHIEIQRGLWL